MRTSTFIGGLLVTIVGVIAVLRGLGTEFDLPLLAVILLLTLAIGFAVAAFAPRRTPEPLPPNL